MDVYTIGDTIVALAGNASSNDRWQSIFFFFQAEDGIRDLTVTGIQTCAVPISFKPAPMSTLKYRKELERLERAFNVHFNTLWNMLSSKKATLQRKFFDTVTTRVMRTFDV